MTAVIPSGHSLVALESRGKVGHQRMVPSLGRHSALTGEESGIGEKGHTDSRASGALHCETHPALQSKSSGNGVSRTPGSRGR